MRIQGMGSMCDTMVPLQFLSSSCAVVVVTRGLSCRAFAGLLERTGGGVRIARAGVLH